jgi:hypothetical protein
VSAATTVWNTVSHLGANRTTTLTQIHTPAALTTRTAVSGRDACRSTRDSRRLIEDRDPVEDGSFPVDAGSAMAPGPPLLLTQFPGQFIAAHLRPSGQIALARHLV